MSDLRDLQNAAHALAREKGWYIGIPRSPLEYHMLIVSEIAEASEAVRGPSKPPVYQTQYFGPTGSEATVVLPSESRWRNDVKPEGELVELADAVLRILDYCGYRGWDLNGAVELKHKFNATRPHRHGGKRL